MANSTRHSTGAGTMKAPEFAWDFVDGLSFTVAASITSATVTAGTFDIQTTGTIDNAGVDGWPAAGHVCVNGRVFSYTSISGDSFIGCSVVRGDQAAAAITAGEFGYQAVPASILNMMLQMLTPGQVYESSTQTGLNVSIAAFRLMSGTTELTAYAGGTLALTDATVNYVYGYNNGGGAAVAKSTVSWADAATAAGGAIILLAKITTAGGVVTAHVDARANQLLSIPGAPASGVSGSGTDNHVVRWDGTSAIQDTGIVIDDDDDITMPEDGTIAQAGSTNGIVLYTAMVTGDTWPRMEIVSSGAIAMGSGSSNPITDVSISRLAPNEAGVNSGCSWKVGSQAGDHGSTTEGTISYNLTSDKFRFYQNSAWVSYAPDNPEYIVATAHTGLSAERVLGVGTGLDILLSAGNIEIDLDFTELGDVTFGSGSTMTWTFNAGATDPTIQFASGEVRFNSAHANVDHVFEGDTDTALVHIDAGLDMVGISTATPNSRLHVDGSQSYAYRAVTGNATLGADDYILKVTLSGATAAIIDLPAASGVTGRVYIVVRADADFTSSLTIEPNGTDAWEGTGSGNGPMGVLAKFMFFSDGAGWWLISQ